MYENHNQNQISDQREGLLTATTAIVCLGLLLQE